MYKVKKKRRIIKTRFFCQQWFDTTQFNKYLMKYDSRLFIETIVIQIIKAKYNLVKYSLLKFQLDGKKILYESILIEDKSYWDSKMLFGKNLCNKRP